MSKEDRVKKLLADQNQQGHLFAILVESKWDHITEADRRAYIRAYSKDTSKLNNLGTLEVGTFAGLYFAVDRYVLKTSKAKILCATAALAVGFSVYTKSLLHTKLSDSLSNIYSKYNFTTNPEALSILA